MTEQEAIVKIKDQKRLCLQTGYIKVQGITEALDIATKALEEVQQYRALGTVEELKEAKEKQIAKKVLIKHHEKTPWTRDISQYLCPCCDRVIGFNGQIHCSTCGQKLLYDWGNEDAE